MSAPSDDVDTHEAQRLAAGGMNAWAVAGQPVVRDDGTSGFVG